MNTNIECEYQYEYEYMYTFYLKYYEVVRNLNFCFRER